jgi:hypothetical protein
LAVSADEKFGGLQVKILSDYHPAQKVASVKKGETAFNRDELYQGAAGAEGGRKHSNVIHVSWLGELDSELIEIPTGHGYPGEGKKVTRTELARLVAREVGDIYLGKKGATGENASYTNYGGSSVFRAKSGRC